MVEPKISLTIEVPGTALMSPQEYGENPESWEENKVLLSYTKGKGKWKKEVKKVFTYKTKKTLPAKQVINMSQEAYDWMLSTPVNQKKYSKIVYTDPKTHKMSRLWDTMSEHERLSAHFAEIACDFQATGFSYEVLGD